MRRDVQPRLPAGGWYPVGMATVSTASRFMFSTRKRTSRLQHLGAFALEGELLMLVFPRPGWGFLAYVAFVPVGVAAARTRDWRRLFWTSAVVFAAWWCLMLRWLAGVSPAGPPVLGAWLGVNVALGVLAMGVLHQKLRWPMVVAVPLCWVSVEARLAGVGVVPLGVCVLLVLTYAAAGSAAPGSPGSGVFAVWGVLCVGGVCTRWCVGRWGWRCRCVG